MMALDKTNSLAVQEEINWADIIDAVAEDVDLRLLPEKALEAVPYMMAGLPKTEVAKLIGVSRSTLSEWLDKYPSMQIAISQGRTMAQQWRLGMLEAQFVKALKLSNDILSLPLNGRQTNTIVGEDSVEEEDETVNSKTLTAIGQHVRFIIDKFVSSKREIAVTHELGNTVLDARKDALDYLAMQMSQLGQDSEPVEVSYRVIDGKFETTGPMLDSDGNPNFGVLGLLDTDADGRAQCHDCGQFFVSLSTHIRKTMNLSVSEYEILYGLELGTVTKVSP